MEASSIITIESYLEFVATNENNPYIPLLTTTPSEFAGLSKENERKWRLYGTILIQELGILLKLSQSTIACASIIFHRFYYKKTFMKCDCSIAALASLFIATKTEEQPRKLRDTISTFDYVKKMMKNFPRPIPVLNLGSMNFTSLKKDAINAERYIMKALGFSISFDLPYKYLWEYIKLLQGTNRLRQKAWNYINDALKTVAIVCFPPSYIAVASIEMAARSLNYGLPDCEWYKGN